MLQATVAGEWAAAHHKDSRGHPVINGGEPGELLLGRPGCRRIRLVMKSPRPDSTVPPMQARSMTRRYPESSWKGPSDAAEVAAAPTAGWVAGLA
jgi:hypothetical protein